MSWIVFELLMSSPVSLTLYSSSTIAIISSDVNELHSSLIPEIDVEPEIRCIYIIKLLCKIFYKFSVSIIIILCKTRA